LKLPDFPPRREAARHRPGIATIEETLRAGHLDSQKFCLLLAE
jgi:hypothetical protein